MDRELILSMANNNDTPFYLYDMRVINEKAGLVKSAFLEFNLLYSIKANPNATIIKNFVNLELGFDAASVNEVQLAKNNGASIDNIYYSSPGKSMRDLKMALDCCQIIVDSIGEIDRLNSLASAMGRTIQIGVRLNIENNKMQQSTHEVMGGVSSKFGISLEEFLALRISDFIHIDIIGIHVYFGSQILDIGLISGNFHIIAETALILKEKYNIKYVNFGGGFGVPYEKKESCIEIEKLSHHIHKDSIIQKLISTSITLNIELGRFLVAECGYFVSKILDIKTSYGKKFAIIDGGMNSFFRPMMTGDFHDVVQFQKKGSPETVTLAGKLCTPMDKYYDDLSLYSLSVGDIIAFKNAGAYGFTMSLLEFSSFGKPKEIVFGESKNEFT